VYFHHLANQAQIYYREQTDALGWDASKELSKTCGRVATGGPAFAEGEYLRCQINVTVNNTNTQMVANDSTLSTELRTTLTEEGFRVSTPARTPLDNLTTPLLLGVAPDGCNTTLESVSDPGFVTPVLEYSLSCGGNVARDVPSGFVYNKVVQPN
jgi:hypothetical protein